MNYRYDDVDKNVILDKHHNKVTRRMRKICELRRQGKKQKEIAELLKVSLPEIWYCYLRLKNVKSLKEL
jgi:DNA-binding NarL/FixJ family response regulator